MGIRKRAEFRIYVAALHVESESPDLNDALAEFRSVHNK